MNTDTTSLNETASNGTASSNGPAGSSDGSAQGSSDEAIGRPQEWREGRYQRPGKSITPSVVPPATGESRRPDTISTPVTRKDYEQGNGCLADRALAQWNIGGGVRSGDRVERSAY